jgi:hypothetical protein
VLEGLGWVATALFVASYFCKDQGTLRRVQAGAALLWIVYGLAIQSGPVIASNVLVAAIAAYSSWDRKLPAGADAPRSSEGG